MIASVHRRRIRAPGLFALYVAGYSGFRIFEELLRVDPAHRILGLRLNFYVASLLCVAGLTWFVAIQRGWRLRPLRRGAGLLGLAWIVAWAAGCGSSRSTALPQAQGRAYVPISVAMPIAGELSWSAGKPARRSDGADSALTVRT